MRTKTARTFGPKGLELEGFSADRRGATLFAASTGETAACPTCARRSARVHSRYTRTVADLPWHGASVTLRVRARRFFCDEGSCERRIFCERLPDVAARARKTGRLEEALLASVLELGGRGGARLAAELGLLAGRDALFQSHRGAVILPES